MNKTFHHKTLIAFVTVFFLGTSAMVANASHSWGGYHWARTTNPFTLKLGDNVSSAWDPYLSTTSKNWSNSSVLDTTIVPGKATTKCLATTGRVEVCNKTYGSNGWLGIASISIKGTHITKGTVKVNDTYFNTTKYNTPAWKNLVMCQEVGHTFGLNHQDEIFDNLNLGTCMDYTNDPDGTLSKQASNVQPNQHDFEQLVNIYGHVESTTTIATITALTANAGDENSEDPADWGKEIRKDARGRGSLFEKDLGKGNRVLTFVVWAQ